MKRTALIALLCLPLTGVAQDPFEHGLIFRNFSEIPWAANHDVTDVAGFWASLVFPVATIEDIQERIRELDDSTLAALRDRAVSPNVFGFEAVVPRGASEALSEDDRSALLASFAGSELLERQVASSRIFDVSMVLLGLIGGLPLGGYFGWLFGKRSTAST